MAKPEYEFTHLESVPWTEVEGIAGTHEKILSRDDETGELHAIDALFRGRRHLGRRDVHSRSLGGGVHPVGRFDGHSVGRPRVQCRHVRLSSPWYAPRSLDIRGRL